MRQKVRPQVFPSECHFISSHFSTTRLPLFPYSGDLEPIPILLLHSGRGPTHFLVFTIMSGQALHVGMSMTSQVRQTPSLPLSGKVFLLKVLEHSFLLSRAIYAVTISHSKLAWRDKTYLPSRTHSV